MIRGGRESLTRTRYIHTEYGNNELYEGQAGLEEVMQMLPQFRILVRWENDALLWKSLFQKPPKKLIEVPD
jgi:hypothetical protein